MALIFRYPLTILEKHLDSFGHVNNATYLHLYEEARWDFITKRGFGLARVLAGLVGFASGVQKRINQSGRSGHYVSIYRT